MIEPITAYIVSAGIYDDYHVLAVFTELTGAREYADHFSLSKRWGCQDDKARVEEIDLYGPGWRRPPSDVIDGEVVGSSDHPAIERVV